MAKVQKIRDELLCLGMPQIGSAKLRGIRRESEIEDSLQKKRI